MPLPVVYPEDLSIFYLSPYHYVPTESVCVTFVVLFSIVTFLHVVGAIRYRLWWLLPTVCLAGGGEIAGWIARLASSHSVVDSEQRNPFLIQIVTTILAPTPLLGAIFIIFARLSERLGVEYGRLSPRLYSRVFLSCDIIALLVQGVGGGVAASAQTVSGTNLGSNIMLGGIIFQMVAMLTFIFLMVEYFTRFFSNAPLRPVPQAQDLKAWDSNASLEKLVTVRETRAWTTKLKLMSLGVGLCTLFLLIRAIYRTAELADGWNGQIIATQVLFNVFDGAMVVLTMYTLIFLHPGFLLGPLDVAGIVRA